MTDPHATSWSTMNRRAFLLAGLASAGTMALGACSSDDDGSPSPSTGVDLGAGRPGSERVDEAVPRPTLRLPGNALGFPSPFAYASGIGYNQMSLLYDTLLWKDAEGVLPWLATRFDRSEDGRTYTFELRDNVVWHDGEALTADDVAFTFDYYATQDLGPLLAAVPVGVAETVAVSPFTVEIRLTEPAVTFLESVAARVPIAPRHIWESMVDPAAALDQAVLIGSGPYRLDSFETDGALAFVAHDGYFLGRPFVERIEISPVGDELNALLAGDIDASSSGGAPSGRAEVLAPFVRDDRFGIIEQRGAFAVPLYWNLDRGGALAHVVFRQACAMAIDRDDLVERLTGGNGDPGNPGFLPPTNPFHVDVEQYRFDPDAANALLDDDYPRDDDGIRRGAQDGRRLSFELKFANDQVPLAELLAPALRAIGVELSLSPVELGPALFGAKLGGNFDLLITLYPGPGGFPPNSDPDLLRPIYSALSGPGFASPVGYQNTEMDEIAERQLVTADEAERGALVTRIQEIAAEDIPLLPLYYGTSTHIFVKDVLDQWYYAPGGSPGTHNKALFVTGQMTGLDIRPTTD